MSTEIPTIMTPEAARRMYRRVLASWAQDLLLLRSAGMDRPGRARDQRRVESAESIGYGLMGGEGAWPATRAA